MNIGLPYKMWARNDTPTASARGARLLRKLEPYTFVAPAIITLGALLIYPTVYMIIASFAGFDRINFVPKGFVGLLNYKRELLDPHFWSSVWVTLIFLAISLPLQMALGFAIAGFLAIDWRGKGLVRALYIIPMVVTPVVAGSMFKMLLDPSWGLFSYLWTLVTGTHVVWFESAHMAMISIIIIDTWRWTPFVSLMALAGILSLPEEPFEAAMIDGAGFWQSLWYVAVPLLKPVLLSTAVVRFLQSIKVFDHIYSTTMGGPGTATEVLNLYIYNLALKRFSFDKAFAASTAFVALALLFMFVYVRFSVAQER